VVFDFCTKKINGCLSGEYIIPGVVAVVVDVITINNLLILMLILSLSYVVDMYN